VKLLKQKNSGFSLIETVLVMIILGLCLTPFAILMVNVMSKNIYSQAQATSVALAEGEIERLTMTRFSLLANEASSAFPSPFSAYSKQAAVMYVNPNALNTNAGAATNYRNVQVQVSNSISGNITLTTLVANDW
jgi:prepilin-type N-terminal cleavage/methylation domain-containing protein